MARHRVRDDPPPPAPGRPGQAQQVPIRHDLTNEQVILAAMASDADTRARIVKRATADSFFGKGHPQAFAALAELHRLGLEYSPATLRQVSGGSADEAYVEKVVAAFGAPPNLAHHLTALDWDRTRVEVVRGPLTKLIKILQDPTQPPEAVRAVARMVGSAFDGHGTHRLLHDPNELVRTQLEEIRRRREGQSLFPFGVEGLDEDERGETRMIPGAAPGQTTVIVGTPGSAKSTFTARIALGQVELGRRVLYGSWEVKGGMTLELLACMRLNMSRRDLLTGRISEADLELVREQMEIISGYVRFFKLPGRERGQKRTNDQILDEVEAYVSDTGCDVAIFDLWKRCLRYTDPDDEEQALYRQQDIHARCDVHGILVQQLRGKEVEQRANQRPTREGIKGSSAWFEVPDTLMGMYRPGLSKKVDDTIAEVDVLKLRWGVFPVAVEFDWDGDRGSFENGRTVPYEPPTVSAESDLISNFKVNADEGARPRRARG